jgi:hypothetical protein
MTQNQLGHTKSNTAPSMSHDVAGNVSHLRSFAHPSYDYNGFSVVKRALGLWQACMPFWVDKPSAAANPRLCRRSFRVCHPLCTLPTTTMASLTWGRHMAPHGVADMQATMSVGY